MTGVNPLSEWIFFLLSLCRNYVEPVLLFVVWLVYQQPSRLPASGPSMECSGESLERGQPLHTAPTVSPSRCAQRERDAQAEDATANEEALECVCVGLPKCLRLFKCRQNRRS